MATARAPARPAGRPRSRPRSFEAPKPSAAERTGIAYLDPMLVLAAIGIIGFSILTLSVTTQNDIEGNPYFFVIRQSIYAVIGIALMRAIARIDESRFRELRVGLYTAMISTSSHSSPSSRPSWERCF